MRVAVTAANGQLGSSICKQLISEIGSENLVGIARTTCRTFEPGLWNQACLSFSIG